MLFGPPYWISDLLPVICIVFEQPIKTAPPTDLSRVVRFVKPCAVRNEDSRYEIEVVVDMFHKSIQYALEKLGKSKSGFERTSDVVIFARTTVTK